MCRGAALYTEQTTSRIIDQLHTVAAPATAKVGRLTARAVQTLANLRIENDFRAVSDVTTLTFLAEVSATVK